MNKSGHNDKVAIVTGAARGIGYGFCRALAEQGIKVLLNDIDEDLTHASVAQLMKDKLQVMGMPGDAGDYKFINQLVNKVYKKYGRLDLVVANAGITLFGDFLTYNPEDFFKVMRVNLGGSFFLAQAAANIMKNQEGGGKILFLSSVTGHQAHKNLAAYGMTKAALEMLAKSLVIELSGYNINVNTIAPGATITERTSEDIHYNEIWSRLTPMGRPADVQDVVNAGMFLLSDAARHITGQSLIIDGGWTSISPGPESI